MRDDMKRVIITRPRHGSSFKNEDVKEQRRRVRDDPDYDPPQRRSMKPKGKFSWHKKELSDFLNPLIRFLQKNCGRPWNKVYSEICQNLDRRGIINDHIFQHLEDWVETKPIWKANKPHTTGYGGCRPLWRDGYTFYVDRSGLLQEPKEKRQQKRKEENPNIIKTDDKNKFFAKRPDNTWFEVTISEPDSYDIYCRSAPEWLLQLQPYYLLRKSIALRTLSKKEKLKLLEKK